MTFLVAIGSTLGEAAAISAASALGVETGVSALAAGMGGAATAATPGLIGAIGTAGGVLGGAAGGAAAGAGLGALGGAITGQGAGQGAKMGALTGAIGAGLAPAVGAAGAAAGAPGTMANMAARVGTGALVGGAANAAGAAIGGKPIGPSAMLGGITGGALAGLNAPAATPAGEIAPTGPIQGPGLQASGATTHPYGAELPTSSTSGPSGLLGTIGSKVSDIGHSLQQMPLTKMAGNVAILGAGMLGQHQIDQSQKAQEAAKAGDAQAQSVNQGSNALAPQVAGIYGSGSTPNNPLGGLGKMGYASGGHVPLKNGAYIIPADVVSALGNGSSKAGAEFLQRLMVQVKHEATKRQGLGAARAHAA